MITRILFKEYSSAHIYHVCFNTELDLKYCTGLRDFPQIFAKMAERQTVAGISPLAELNWEISTRCKPFSPTRYVTKHFEDINNLHILKNV